MSLSVAIVCEAAADRASAVALAERLLLGSAPWIEADRIGDFVHWRGFRKSDPFLPWTGIKSLVREHAIVARFRSGLPKHPYSQQALRAIRLLAASPDRVDAMLLMADTDNDLGRSKGFEQAREQNALAHLPIIIALPHTKRECWHIAGFEPADAIETERLATLRAELGFDPRYKSQELTAKHDPGHTKRSAKRVLMDLSLGDRDREAQCLMLPFVELEARGLENGLTDFLNELRLRLIHAQFNPALRTLT
jgi:hypothetical protein